MFLDCKKEEKPEGLIVRFFFVVVEIFLSFSIFINVALLCVYSVIKDGMVHLEPMARTEAGGLETMTGRVTRR